MRSPAFERLNSQHSSFVMFEQRATHMHVGVVGVFELGPLATADGGLDTERISKFIGSRIHNAPLYRKKLSFTPIQRQPIWVDDGRFNLAYHVRHTSLPKPGNDRVLKRLTGRILSQHLDREKPLWETWLVEGLEGDRFALIAKVHHCMVDGAWGVNLMSLLLSESPDQTIEPPESWLPRPEPSRLQLLIDEGLQLSRLPLAVLQGLRLALTSPREACSSFAEGGKALWQAVTAGFPFPISTPLNRPIGPHRKVDWRVMDLDQVKALKNRLDGTVADVVLAVVTGALRVFLEDRGVELEGLDFRIVVPLSLRSGAMDLVASSPVSGLFLPLPISEPDPLRRFALVRKGTRRLKDSKAAKGIDLFARFADWTGSPLLVQAGVQVAATLHPYNLIVTNVKGPQHPLYLLGARMLGIFPQLPLFDHQGLGVAVLSYDGKIHWGLTGDWDLLPDIYSFAGAVDASLEELRDAARGA
jgi:WS/DGAT/MGAT family acyltransferase